MNRASGITIRTALLAIFFTVALLGEKLPPGTPARVRLNHTISSATARPGDVWHGTLARDLVVDGKVVARKGTPVTGIIVDARPSGRLSSPGLLKLRVTSIGNMPVRTNVRIRQATSHKKRNIGAIGGGAGAGALIGAIAGGGKGAAIGAGAGAAAGTAGAAVTGKKDVSYPAETVITFRIR